MIITIDGPVATGKSTIAKKLAEQLSFIYYDTGAMYRCVTYAILKNSIDLDLEEALRSFLKNLNFDVKIMHHERLYFIEEEDVTLKIRGREITEVVSKVSAHPLVRDHLVQIQRKLSEGVNAVFEGRDMGTVVFPDASIKVFLTGNPEIRAARRYAELLEKFPEESLTFTLEQCLSEIMARDHYDSTRAISPLTKAKDALVIDTSDITVDEVVFKIFEYKDNLKTKHHH